MLGSELISPCAFGRVAPHSALLAYEPGSPADDACFNRNLDASEERSHRNLNLIWAGTGLLGVSLIAGYAILPGRGAFLRFVNKHNQLRPYSPLQLQLGFDRSKNMAGAGLRLRF